MRWRIVFATTFLAASACASRAADATEPVLYVYRIEPPAFLQLNDARVPVREIPFSLPQGCGLGSLHAAPQGSRLAIELSCAFGPAVLWLEARTATLKQPIRDSDSHFLAWAPDSLSMYLKIDGINRPRIVRVMLDGRQRVLPISEFTYDIAPAPSGDALTFALSEGMGLGSELWVADENGAAPRLLAKDPANYLSLARWSPDGEWITYITIPDTPESFTIGELWAMAPDGTAKHKLAFADAGHGFAPAWSPDGQRIAFVKSTNSRDSSTPRHDVASPMNVYLVGVGGGTPAQLTDFADGLIGAPVWMPGQERLAFSATQNDRMAVYVLDLVTGSMQSIPIDSICCAAWVRD